MVREPSKKIDFNEYQMVFLAYENMITLDSVKERLGGNKVEPSLANITNIAYKLSLVNFF